MVVVLAYLLQLVVAHGTIKVVSGTPRIEISPLEPHEQTHLDGLSDILYYRVRTERSR